MRPEFDFRLTGVGWAVCTVRFGDAACEVTASCLSDALGKLVLGAAAIASGLHAVSIGFDEEPGEYRWSVTRESATQVRVAILEFSELWSNKPDSDGQVLLEFICDPHDFGEAVWLAASAVSQAWPDAAYVERSGGLAFPHDAMNLLGSALGLFRRVAT